MNIILMNYTYELMKLLKKKCYDKVKFASGYILSLSLSFAFGICILKADISFLCVVIDLPL